MKKKLKDKRAIETFFKEKRVDKNILRKEARVTLDLRPRPEREVPVKQHGFKEGEVSYKNILNQ